ncbi:uncharacterized protein MONOS_2734 [Monocercomonoides exilis]|uniref:uncharacterized protein n=1 Tax=Monocercomonoides exilis TaxID=2049356 RepID=UPI00355A6385|nr:hypothetical protein MONOS_2734 [Monocercomonoides exilis]|eukprot:MONOS_2734.1-p1 / transcript=MONOS_2734.1 / gene=MONOS_2734 / organism=Monocercomonoides_exilis_PA203 / gene_product=unspecified product / transcript_product=unspecified product / location=Mono_scaffold00058:22033-22242(+) / protein_length=70 / sequence_SO=supercontig / SO=protein_coding / is_pseudo=false
MGKEELEDQFFGGAASMSKTVEALTKEIEMESLKEGEGKEEEEGEGEREENMREKVRRVLEAYGKWTKT